MTFKLLALVAVVAGSLVACAGPEAEEAEATGGATEDLKSADCPPAIEVEVAVPQIPSNEALQHAYLKDFSGDPDPAKGAADQLQTVAPFLATVRSDKAVSLKGTVVQACAYKTVDAHTGAQSDHRVWLAKSGDALSLRIDRGVDFGIGEDVVFMNVPLKSLSPTSLVVDTSKSGRVYAEDDSRGHDGSDGFSIWIGDVKVTARVAH